MRDSYPQTSVSYFRLVIWAVTKRVTEIGDGGSDGSPRPAGRFIHFRATRQKALIFQGGDVVMFVVCGDPDDNSIIRRIQQRVYMRHGCLESMQIFGNNVTRGRIEQEIKTHVQRERAITPTGSTSTCTTPSKRFCCEALLST